MFRELFLTFCLIGLTVQIKMFHEQNLDLNNLNAIQKQTDSFFRQKIPDLKDAKLTIAQQDGNKLTYNYKSAPVGDTIAYGEIVNEQQKKIKLLEVKQKVIGVNGDLTKSSETKAYSTESFETAMKNLGWN